MGGTAKSPGHTRVGVGEARRLEEGTEVSQVLWGLVWSIG